MTHQVPWNKVIFNEFCELAMLNDLEVRILETRIQGHSITKQAMEFNLSESTINRITNRLKTKYDIAQAHSAVMPPRVKSDTKMKLK